MSRQSFFEETEGEGFYHRPPTPPLPQPHRISTQVPSPSYREPYPSSPGSPLSPTAHPDSHFERLRAARRYSRDEQASQPLQNYGEPADPVSTSGDRDRRIWGQPLNYRDSVYSNITPGADNFGERAAGGIAGIAMGVADTQPRESGLEAMRNTPGYDPELMRVSSYPESPLGGQPLGQPDPPYARPQAVTSQTSLQPLGAAASSPGMAASHSQLTLSQSLSHPSINDEAYVENPSDNPYNRYSRSLEPGLAAGLDPNSIEDDGDDGLEYVNSNRGSRLSMAQSANNAPPAAARAAAAGGIIGSLGGIVGRGANGNQSYDPVQNTAYEGPSEHDIAPVQEKSAWLSNEFRRNRKMAWIVAGVAAFVIIGAIVGGVVGGVVGSRHSSSSKSSSSSSSSSSSGSGSGQSNGGSTSSSGDFNADSPEVRALMNNKNLHKVFPGIDYTPMNTQYPGCLTVPPSQNNVTLDLAILSQLTNTVRLYGTDCNQTEMLLHSIDQLKLNGTIKVWLGVWLDNNSTTNDRQLQQMYNILDKYGDSSFVGVIVGNEVLYRQDMTSAELGAILSGVRQNFTAKGINLPVATSDLGDDWTAELASEADYLMANIHPFFAGVNADVAASWTYDFWTNHDTILQTDLSKNIIAETGWPSAGGMDCGGAPTCVNGSVAGIPQMNTFMDQWVCQALANGTTYFWFEAFDEPWKIIYDTPGKDWEDKWGLLDVNRNLKPGVVIPDCGGKTV